MPPQLCCLGAILIFVKGPTRFSRTRRPRSVKFHHVFLPTHTSIFLFQMWDSNSSDVEIKWLMKKDMDRQAGTKGIMKINFTWYLERKPLRMILDQCLLEEANEPSHMSLKKGLKLGMRADPRKCSSLYLMETRDRCCGLLYHLN